ncbi:MAG: hypothetical protein Q8Q85_09545, partial [Gemmatimonadales bacterium]|nr:hypothetical protein [Gemmatimonadales bacterium]
MRAPAWALALGVALLTGYVAVAAHRLWREGDAGVVVAASGALLMVVLSVLVAAFTWRLARVERRWSAVREARIAADSRRLGNELEGAVRVVRGLADRAAPALDLAPASAFEAVGRLLARRGAATNSVVLFDAHGQPMAWAGPQRVALVPEGPPLAAVMTPFYLWLVARRQTDAGTAVATLLLARDSATPSAGVAFADQFAGRTGDGLRFFDPASAPADSDVFDYQLDGDTLFAVQPVPPEQAVARDRLRAGARRLVFWAVVLLLLAGVTGAVRLRLPLQAALLPVG